MCTSKFVARAFPVANASREFSLLQLEGQPVSGTAVDVYFQSAAS